MCISIRLESTELDDDEVTTLTLAVEERSLLSEALALLLGLSILRVLGSDLLRHMLKKLFF